MRRNKLLPIAGIIIFIIVLVIIAVIAGKSARPTEETEELSLQGVTYLQELEAKDPTIVETILKQLRQQKLLEQREEYLSKLESGELSVWTLFDDYVLLGDSRAVGFEYFEYLDSNRVMAEAGATILALQEHIPDIVSYNPSYIFLCYGLNDVSIGIWPTPQEYVENFTTILAEIQAELPDAKIYISSILPARDPAFATSSAWYNIPEYSAAVEVMCNGIDNCYYIDNSEIVEEHSDMWEVDGIHVRTGFYPYWGTNMIMEVYDSELEQNEDPAA